jgi:cytidylate kinase
MLISGPLATGKTIMSEKLAEFYNLPCITIESVINEWMVND